MTCPHDDALRPRGDCYYDLKVKIGLLGDRDHVGTVTAEEAAFVGLLGTSRSNAGWSTPSDGAYPPTNLEIRRDLLREERQMLRYMISERTAARLRVAEERMTDGVVKPWPRGLLQPDRGPGGVGR